jgi:hypothetical protein
MNPITNCAIDIDSATLHDSRTTDNSGECRLTMLIPGMYTLTITGREYPASTIQLTFET